MSREEARKAIAKNIVTTYGIIQDIVNSPTCQHGDKALCCIAAALLTISEALLLQDEQSATLISMN